jgi:hypothetical protein
MTAKHAKNIRPRIRVTITTAELQPEIGAWTQANRKRRSPEVPTAPRRSSLSARSFQPRNEKVSLGK